MSVTEIHRDIAGLKFGSDLVVDEATGQIRYDALEYYAEQIQEVAQEFHPVIFTSGATVAGRALLERNHIDITGLSSQEFAAAGTDEISTAWKKVLMARRMASGQVLANHDQMKRGSVLTRTLLHGIGARMVYVINENDQENLFELELYKKYEQQAQQSKQRVKKPGVDNDFLAARGMSAIKDELQAEGITTPNVHLVLFTAIGGFMVQGAIQPVIYVRDKDYLISQCEGKSEQGTGGMELKLGAAFLAVKNGVYTSIAAPNHRFLDILHGVHVKDTPLRTRVLQ